MKNNTIISFKVPEFINKELEEYASNHYITKSDFIRNAVIEKLQELDDSNYINEVLNNKGKNYTHEELLLELGI